MPFHLDMEVSPVADKSTEWRQVGRKASEKNSHRLC